MDNLQVKTFCNSGLRPAMTKLAEAYEAAEKLLRDYDATRLSEILPSEFDNIIEDGYQSDGRPPISCGGVKLTMENIRGLIAQLNEIDQNTGLSMIQGVRAISPRYQAS